MLRTMMSPTCSSLTQAPISSWQRSASASRQLAAGDLGEIELDRRVLAVDAVVERRQRLDLVVVGRLVELHDALQHDLDRLADAHHLARRVGERLAGRVERALVERATVRSRRARLPARAACIERHDPFGKPVDEAGERHAGNSDERS